MFPQNCNDINVHQLRLTSYLKLLFVNEETDFSFAFIRNGPLYLQIVSGILTKRTILALTPYMYYTLTPEPFNFQHPSTTIVKGAGMVLKAIIEVCAFQIS